MADDLFQSWLPGLWTKQTPEGTPPVFVLRRFLSSEQDYAEAARFIQAAQRDPRVEYRIWQAILPKARSAPRLSYPAPTRSAKETALVGRIMAVEALSRADAEEAVAVLTVAQRLAEALAYYGVEGEPGR